MVVGILINKVLILRYLQSLWCAPQHVITHISNSGNIVINDYSISFKIVHSAAWWMVFGWTMSFGPLLLLLLYATQELDMQLQHQRVALLRQKQSLQALGTQEKDLSAQLHGSRAALCGLHAHISKLDQSLLKQRDIMYNQVGRGMLLHIIHVHIPAGKTLMLLLVMEAYTLTLL